MYEPNGGAATKADIADDVQDNHVRSVTAYASWDLTIERHGTVHAVNGLGIGRRPELASLCGRERL